MEIKRGTNTPLYCGGGGGGKEQKFKSSKAHLLAGELENTSKQGLN